jgi:hypothetical protein
MSFLSKFTKGTRSRFSKRTDTPGTRLPTTVPEPVIPARTEPNPAQDHDATVTIAKPTDQVLIPDDPPVRSKLTKPENKAQEGQSSTEPHTSTNFGTEDIFGLTWRSEANYRMVAERHPEVNTYVPSSLGLFSLLEAAEKRVNTTKHVSQHEVDYLPYAVKVYYAIMYYMQILRARRESGVIEGFENSLLKRFEIKYPMNSLPCAEIVFGYFSTIIATQLPEAKYDWIVPRIATTGAPARPLVETALSATPVANGAAFLQPLVPHMIAILNTFIHQTTTTLPDHMEEGDTYIPVDLHVAAHGDAHIFNVDIRDNTDTHQNMKDVLACAGVSTPFIFGNNNYAQAAKYARRSDFGRDIKPVVTTQDVAGTDLDDAYTYSDLDTFLLMPKQSDLRFFAYLREQAVIHARFFDKVYHFSDVQTTGGLETTVICQLKLDRSNANGGRQYDNVHTDVTRQAQWYHNPFTKLIAGFATNRAGMRRNEELQAFAYGINSNLPIHIVHIRTGAFWRNHEWIQSLNFDVNDDNVPLTTTMVQAGKPMFTDHNSITLRCFRETPHGTGIVDNEH